MYKAKKLIINLPLLVFEYILNFTGKSCFFKVQIMFNSYYVSKFVSPVFLSISKHLYCIAVMVYQRSMDGSKERKYKKFATI